jgi:hypothetical protein
MYINLINIGGNMRGSQSNGIGFFGALGLLFIVLKLVGVISWPWIVVLAPLWLPFGMVLAIFALAVFWGLLRGDF